MFDESTLTLPPRRNVKVMTELLGELANGDIVTATFLIPRYGPVAVSGVATLSPSVKSFFLGGLPIENNLKPDKTLQSLEITRRVSTHWDPEVDETPIPGPIDRADDVDGAIAALEHGSLVEATFHVPVYGDFTIAAPAVWSAIGGGHLLGGWILGGTSTAAPAVRTARVIAGAGQHAVPVPAKITAVGDDLAAV